MFSSPAIRPISNENPADLVARKPNLNVPKSTRKPFGDRAVNDPTPIKNFNLKPRVQLNKTPITVHKENKDDMTNYDIFSFKEPPDNFEDICPKNEQLTSEDLLNIFLPFCGYRNLPTPPPYIRAESPKIDFNEKPLNFPESIDFPELKEEFDISLPEIDDSLSDFDKSL